MTTFLHIFRKFACRASRLRRRFPLEITETPKSYRITVELPGVDADDVKLELDGEVLMVRSERRNEHEEKEEDYTRSERRYGAFERRMTLPTDALADDIEAKTKSGVLRITVPRDHDASAERRQIEVHSAD